MPTNLRPTRDARTFSPQAMHLLEERVREKLPLAGQVVLLYRTDLVRFHGMGMDESDLYYIVSSFPLDKNGKPNTYWATAVGHLDGLKGYLPDPVYKGIDDHFTLNNIVAPRFQILVQNSRNHLIPYLLTDSGLVRAQDPVTP
jgi:hypothetical protein